MPVLVIFLKSIFKPKLLLPTNAAIGLNIVNRRYFIALIAQYLLKELLAVNLWFPSPEVWWLFQIKPHRSALHLPGSENNRLI